MITLDALIRSMADLDAAEVGRWIENGWVRPEEQADSRVEDRPLLQIDAARIRLIGELHRLSIDDEAMPLVLRLLDQVYALRRRMQLLSRAILTQPPSVQHAIRGNVTERHKRR